MHSYTNDNPNAIPIQPRRRTTPAPAPVRDLSQDPGPQLWPSTLDDLLGPVTRAYDVVINYKRDCPTGTRWTRAGIDRVHKLGEYLHADVGVLRGWKRQVHEFGDADARMMRKIDEDWRRVEKTCLEVKRAIDEEEVRSTGGGIVDGEIDEEDEYVERRTDRGRSRSPRQQEDALHGRGRRRSVAPRRRCGGASGRRYEGESWPSKRARQGIAGRLGRYVLYR